MLLLCTTTCYHVSFQPWHHRSSCLFVDLPARVVGLEVGPFSIVGLWVGLLVLLLLPFVDFEDLLPRAVGMRVGWFVFFALLLLLPRLLLLLLRRASILVGLGVLGLAVGMYEG